MPGKEENISCAKVRISINEVPLNSMTLKQEERT